MSEDNNQEAPAETLPADYWNHGDVKVWDNTGTQMFEGKNVDWRVEKTAHHSLFDDRALVIRCKSETNAAVSVTFLSMSQIGQYRVDNFTRPDLP